MKKSIKLLLIMLIVITSLVVLTGCGKKDEETNKNDVSQTPTEESSKLPEVAADLVASRVSEEEGLDGELMKYEEKIEVTFKNDNVYSVRMTYIFENEEDAQSMKSIFDLANSLGEEDEMQFDVELNGKELVMDFDAETYASMVEDTEDATITKAELKAELEENGYTVTVK